MILVHPRCFGAAVFGATVFGAAVFGIGALAVAATSAAAAVPDTLACEGAFGKDTTHAKLVETFGRSNVAYLDVDGDEGIKVKASVIYPDESRRRVYVVWRDEKLRRRPATIRVDFRSGWHTARGLHVGSEIAEVEKINGKAFKLMGFDWNLGGRVSNWQGGGLAKIPGGCELRFGFNPWADAPDDARDKVSGEKEFLSSDPNMRASKPTVSEIIISYPE
jgi:hypothetical protein